MFKKFLSIFFAFLLAFPFDLLATEILSSDLQFTAPEQTLRDTSQQNQNDLPILDNRTNFLFESPLSASHISGIVPALSPRPLSSTEVVTPLPRNSLGQRSEIQTTVSYNPDLLDWSNANIFVFSNTAVQMNFNLYNTYSEASIFVDYDDAKTQSVESVNLLTSFPQGIVLAMDHGGLGAPEIFLEVIDINGTQSTVQLTGITDQTQKWQINTAFFTGVDLSQIKKISLIAHGRKVDGRINLEWGDFQYVPFQYDVPQYFPDLPVQANGALPVMREYVSFSPTPNGDWSYANLTSNTNEDAQLDFTLFNTYSEAAAVIHYDDTATPEIESVNFETAFPQGIVAGLDNGGVGNLSELFLALEDAQGHKAEIKLTQIDSVRKFYRIQRDYFPSSLDFTKIASVSFLVRGRHDSGGHLNIHWGEFTTPTFLNGEAYRQDQISTLPEGAVFHATGGNTVSNQADGMIISTLTGSSESEFEYQYYLWNSPTAFTSLDLDAPGGESFTLPENFVLALRGSEGGQTRVLITDAGNYTASFTLNLKPYYQNYVLNLRENHVPYFFRPDSIRQIRFYQDRNYVPGTAFSDLVKIRLNGVPYVPPFLPPTHQQLKEEIVRDSLKFFEMGQNVDSVTHLPYDRSRADGTVEDEYKIVQPTLTGFYLQMLGDYLRGKLGWEGKSRATALDEINYVIDSLLDIQTQYGWNGLIPWIDQGVPYDHVGIGDNANLAQSIAVMIGALELTDLTSQERAQADLITQKAEQFLENQKLGYEAAVDKTFGLFAAIIFRETGVPLGFLDRLMTEFRGAIAFLLVRYPTLPQSVWDNLEVSPDNDYKTESGAMISNIQSYEGGAFQHFWPLLRNNERDFVGFRNALYNHFVTQADYAAEHRVPGFLSASDQPGKKYLGLIGVPHIAETQEPILLNLGSTYALASAFSVNQFTTLDWLYKIKQQLPHVYGKFGFLDAARSDSDIAQFYLGIDVASTVLGLTNAGPEAFEAYLRNHGKEEDYNLLYERKSQFGLNRTSVAAPLAPEFANRSMSVFAAFTEEGTLGDFPFSPSTVAGASFIYSRLGTNFDGRFWIFPATHDVSNHLLQIVYSIKDSPQAIRIELKDDSEPDQTLYSTVLTLPSGPAAYEKALLQLPDDIQLSRVKKVLLMMASPPEDTEGDFFVHAIDFLHLPSTEE